MGCIITTYSILTILWSWIWIVF